MTGTYEIMEGDRLVGRAKVERQGLYYHFSCRCKLSGEVVYRIIVRCGGKEANLGICVPVDGEFGTDKKVPVKSLGEGRLEFLLLPKHEDIRGKFIPIHPEEPFAYIHRLQDAFLERRGENLGIVIR